MNFDYNEEQQLLADSVRRFIQKDYEFEARRKIVAAAEGYSEKVWGTLAEMGLTGIPFSPDYGGFGGGAVDLMSVMESFGEGLVVEPYLAAAVVAPELIRRVASADFQAEWLPQIATGEAIVIAADGSRLTLDDGRLSGRLDAVAHAACADLLLVAHGDALYAVAPNAEGMTLHDYPMLDGPHAADLSLSAVPAVRVGSGDTSPAWDVGLAALCAEAVGILDATLAATGDYLKTRRQFGQPIGRFQALQHRMADMLLHVEQARSMSWLAALRCRAENLGERQRALSAAKVVIGDACRFVGKNAVQLHGGMGMTDELIVSHWFKRLAAIEMAWGDTDSHLQRFAKLSRAA